MNSWIKKSLVTAGICGVFMLMPMTVSAAEDANGDGYSDSDVAVINRIIEENGLPWEKDRPDEWNDVYWSGWFYPDVEIQEVVEVQFQGMGLYGTLDVTELKSLERLYCTDNNLQSINASNLTNLQDVDCASNEELTEINLDGDVNLTKFGCNGTGIKQLNLSDLHKLTEFGCGETSISELDLSELESLDSLYCAYNENLTQLDLSGLENLTEVDCSSCNLSELNLSGDVELSILRCDGNNLNTLDLTGLSELGSLHCSSNSLTELNLSDLIDLRTLDCSKNKLNELDLSNSTKLGELYCSSNNLSSLDFSNVRNLRFIRCASNNLTQLDVSGLGLYELVCDGNKLTSLKMADGDQITLNSNEGGYINVWPGYEPWDWGDWIRYDGDNIGIEVIASPGYKFQSWEQLPENAEEAKWENEDGEEITGWLLNVTGDVSLSAVFVPESEYTYTVIDGAGSTWTADSGEGITMRADGEFDKFQSVQVDGVTLDPAYYTAEQGSTIITLKPEFLQTLTPGTHTLTIVFTDGSASAEFDIKEVDQEGNPGEEPEEGQKPGDDSKPGDEQQPGDDSKPGDEQQPGEDAGSDDGEQNGDSDKGNSGQQISDPDQNNNNGQGQSKPQQNVNQAKDTDTKDNAAITKTVSSVPKTGDETQVLIFAMFAVASIIICAGISRAKIRTRH